MAIMVRDEEIALSIGMFVVGHDLEKAFDFIIPGTSLMLGLLY